VPIFGSDVRPPADRDLLIEYPESHLAFSAVRTPDDLIYAEYASGEEEMYDLAKDPYQLENVASDPAYAEARDGLAKRLAELRDCAGRACH
jgi:N-acetylglucosamine-6-sulfatase